MSNTNEVTLEFDSKSQNEGFARMVVAAFVSQLDPTMEEIADIKTAISEAVTNAIIHGYDNLKGKILMKCRIEDNHLFVEVSDKGKGIENIKKAMEPLYTTRPEIERSGMGFAFMEAFMDELEVESVLGEGTTIKMEKIISNKKTQL